VLIVAFNSNTKQSDKRLQNNFGFFTSFETAKGSPKGEITKK